MKKKLIPILLLFLPALIYSQTLEDIKKNGVLKVAFTESWKNTVNMSLANEFSKFLDLRSEEVTIKWGDVFSKDGNLPKDHKTNPEISYVPDALQKSDIICGTIYILDWRKKFFDYAGIVQVSDLLIVRKNIGKDVRSYEDLKGLNIAFLGNSTYETEINKINDQIGGGIKFTETNSEEESLDLLNKEKVDGLIAVSYLALSYVNRSLKLAFPVAAPKDVGWAVRKGSNKLKKEIQNFFETIKGNGKLDELFKERYKTDYSTYQEIINSYAQSKKGVKTREFDDIISSGKIIIALRDREMVYHEYGKKQFNHHLAEQFADFLGVQYEIKYTKKFGNYFENENGDILRDSAYSPPWFNEFDVACDLIAPLDWRLKKVDVIDFMPNALVVIGRKNTKITSINDLRKLKGVTSKGSSYEHALLQNKIDKKKLRYTQGNSFFDYVISGKADYTISNISVFKLGDYPELEAKFILGEITKMGWAIKKNQPRLRQKILEFFQYAEANGIFDEYFKVQTGMTMQAAQNYLTALHETYQEGYFPFVFYQSDDKSGLPQEDILSVYQDKEGYMWFGTYDGAVKYNGRSMKIYNLKTGLNNITISDISEDKTGKIYFSTLSGISVLDKRKDSISNYFKGIPFTGAFIDSIDNKKWFYGDKGIYILTGTKEKFLNKEISGLPENVHSVSKSLETKNVAIGASKGLFILEPDKTIRKISNKYCHYAYYDVDGNLWTSTNSGIHFAKKRDVRRSNIGEAVNKTLNISNSIIRRITQTKDGSIWLVADHKVYQLLTLKQKPIVYDKDIGLKKYRILSFLLDNENNLWFGFSGGIQKLNNKSLRTVYPEYLNSYINSIFEDSNDRIWFGTSNDIYYFKEKLSNFSLILKTKFKSFVVTELPNKNLIIANLEGIFLVDKNSLKILKHKKFKNTLFHLEKIFISEKNEIFLLSGAKGVVYYLKDINSEPVLIENYASRSIFQLEEYEGQIIGGNTTGLVIFKGQTFWRYNDLNSQVWSLKKGIITDPETHQETEVLWVGTQTGLGIYRNKEFEFVAPEELSEYVINAILPTNDVNKLWLGTNKGVLYFNINEKKIEFIVDRKDGLSGNEITIDGLFLDGRGLLWIGTYHGPATFDIKKRKTEKYTPVCRIESITLNNEVINANNFPKILSSNQNNLVFEISGLSFKDENSVEYEFYMQGLKNDYGASKGARNIAEYPNLPPGKYSFKYRTKGMDGIWSYYQSINFTIRKPIYLEWWFLAPAILLFILSLWLLFKWRLRILHKRNDQLEATVIKRTAEISEKNSELETQKEEIQTQRDVATNQRDEIIQQKKEIEDSILYAKRIQNAILPPTTFINAILPENFILFKPRDIVSGDFYWAAQKNDSIYFAAADCTGHGVPGAFMSMLGVSFLNEIINSADYEIEASEILDQLKKAVITALHQTGQVHEAKDGMDIALCRINKDKLELEYAGAFNPLYILRNDEFKVIDADRKPIGIYEYDADQDKPFTNNKFTLQKKDMIYIFSDGYPDQFGGPKGKKFMIGRFKKVLSKAKEMPVEEQRLYLDDIIERWRKDVSEQIDDILVIGVRI